jgi:hypothetical protein
MKTSRRSILILSALLSAFVVVALPAQEAKKKKKDAAAAPAAKPLSAERAILVTVSARVETLDKTTRQVTLKGPAGNVVSFKVDPAVKRLNEVNVGDFVTADYYVSLAGELRAPTEAEKLEPISIKEGAAKAPMGSSPAGGAVSVIKVVATVVGLNLTTMTVSLQGPMGNIGDVQAESVENIKKLRLGDTIVVTYTEALAISLEKTKAPAAKKG